MRKFLLFLFWVAITLVFQQCASVQSPQGGPKDSATPKLLSSKPNNGEIDFKGKSILLEYSEDVLENEGKQPFLSPLTQVSVVAIGRKIKITPDSGWIKNQTYELRLSKKVKDEHEGNPSTDSTILFSTGNQISKSKIQIAVENLSAKANTKRSTCLLHGRSNNIYFSSGEGQLKVSGIENGTYLMEVFADKNENLKYEEEDGDLFTDSVRIDSSIEVKARPLPQIYKPIRCFKQKRGDTVVVETSKQIFPDQPFLDHCVGKNREGTIFWLFPVKEQIISSHFDTLGNCVSDTIEPLKIDSNRSLTQLPLKRKSNTRIAGKQLHIQLNWSWKPVHFPEKIEYTKDSVWVKADWEKREFGVELKLPILKQGKLRLRFDSLVFYNKSVLKMDSIDIAASDLDQAGNIGGTIESGKENIRAELLNAAKEILGTAGKGNFQWQVKPGQYTIQIYRDLNGDGRYTGGNKKARRKAEPLYIFPDKIELKPGWDLENIRVKPEF